MTGIDEWVLFDLMSGTRFQLLFSEVEKLFSTAKKRCEMAVEKE